ncbi:MAG: MalY/PatB family protein [Anaerolineae bacterium]|jgi:cystathionine beta-lyase|nr:putative C-S lyase [Chloroflexota bacterium]
MSFDWNCVIDRLDSDSAKWHRYGPDVIPLWVADMDFCAPPAVISALQQRVAHGIFGYGVEPPQLREVFCARLQSRYGWQVAPEALVFVPGVVVGFNIVAQATCRPDQSVLVQTPVYFPMLGVAGRAGIGQDRMQLDCSADGRYTIDMQRMERSLSPSTRLFLMCNPHNPVGRVFTRTELQAMAELCLRHDLLICSDEIHCELIMPGHGHVPIASLDPEIAQRTVTLMAPSKTFNIAGIKFSVAIIPNKELRDSFVRAQRGIVPGIGVLGYTAATAAYEHGDPWLAELLVYLDGNRAALQQFVAERLPGVQMTPLEGTYLAWLDLSRLALPTLPAAFLLEQARVALGEGAEFGPGGEGHVRMNLATNRSTLMDALERIEGALRDYLIR